MSDNTEISMPEEFSTLLKAVHNLSGKILEEFAALPNQNLGTYSRLIAIASCVALVRSENDIEILKKLKAAFIENFPEDYALKSFYEIFNDSKDSKEGFSEV